MARLPADPEGFIRANTALDAPAMVPEFRLWLASEYVPIWQATETWLEEQNVDPPYWAFCWPGGQAVARYLLDHPQAVAGKRVVIFRGDGGRERLGDGVLRIAGVEFANFLAPPGELGACDAGIRTFVHHIIDFTAVGIQRGDGAAALRRQEQKAVVEAGAALHGFLLAIFGGRHAAYPLKSVRGRIMRECNSCKHRACQHQRPVVSL